MARSPDLSIKKLIAMTPEMARAIADFRFAARISSESEAIRRLIEIGLEHSTTAQD